LVSKSYAATQEFFTLYWVGGIMMSILFFMILSLPLRKSDLKAA